MQRYTRFRTSEKYMIHKIMKNRLTEWSDGFNIVSDQERYDIIHGNMELA